MSEQLSEELDTTIRIGRERYNLRDFSDEELVNFMQYRILDKAKAQEDLARAMQVYDERHPEEIDQQELDLDG